jgi:hypothetical protein
MRPITAQPGHTEAEVVAALASRTFVYADCYTISPLVGSPLHYTNARRDITVVALGGSVRQTYKSRAVLIQGLKSHTKIGVQVDTQEITLDYTGETEYQERLSWPQALTARLSRRRHGPTRQVHRDRMGSGPVLSMAGRDAVV